MKRHITQLYTAICASIIALHLFSPPLPGQSSTRNYISEKTYTASGGTSYHETVSYYDGLGRIEETVLAGAWRNSSNAFIGDIISLHEYDSLGRPSMEWLPTGYGTASGASGQYVSPSSLKTLSQSSSAYGDNYPYTETVYDESPLDRTRDSWGAGADWRASTGHKSSVRYLVNLTFGGPYEMTEWSAAWSGDTEIVLTRGSSYSTVGSYTAEETTDEDGRVSLVFKDYSGRTVLERRVLSSTVQADTRYIYNAAGQLTAVLPPALIAALKSKTGTTFTSSSTTEILRYAFLYRYDNKGRLIAKSVPGAGWTYYVYDSRDRLVLSQDANQRSSGKWSFMASDNRGRACLSGTCTNTFDAFSSPLDTVSVVAARDYPAMSTSAPYYGYSISGITLSGADVLSVNWYDDYSFLDKWSIPSASSSSSPTKFEANPSTENLGSRYTVSAHGLLTGTYEKVLGETTGSQYLWTVHYYDDKGREVQKSGLTIRGGYARTNTGYTFSGNPSVVRTVHYDPDNGYMAEKYSYSYDAWERPLVDVYYRTALTSTLPSSFTYTDTKTLHSRTYDRAGRQTVDARLSAAALTTRYSYDIRGHLTSLLVGGNETLGTLGETFTETLRYNNLRNGASNPALWGGDASSMSWMTGDDGIMRNYDYSYDNLGRLTSASYTDNDPNPSPVLDKNSSFTYDLNGNVLTAIRPGSQHTHEFTMQGNRPVTHSLVNVGSLLHPTHTIISSASYSYDSNGNVTSDGDNSRLIEYNILNLPETVTKGTSLFNSPKTKYLYSASGGKLRSTDIAARTGVITSVTDYAGNLIFENGVLKTVLIDGGFISMGNSSTYYYFIADHLGSNRMVVDATGAAHQVTHYGPYGETLNISPSITGTQTESPYKFSGKEWDSDATSYAFGARHYSPTIPFWTSVDPLAEKYYSLSPYAYCAGNPVNLVDPEGMDIWEVDENGRIIQRAKNTKQDEFYLVRQDTNTGEYYRLKDRDGNELGLTFKYGTIENQRSITFLNDKEEIDTYEVFQIRGDDNATALFEFFADNITTKTNKLEYSLTRTGRAGDKGLDFITTSHQEMHEEGFNYLFFGQLRNGYFIREHIHSHSSNPKPSKGDKNSKIKLMNHADKLQYRRPRMLIYVSNLSYYEY